MREESGAAGDDGEYIFRLNSVPSPSVEPAPGISRHETFSNHKNPLCILLRILVPLTQHTNTLAFRDMSCCISQPSVTS